MNKLFSNAPTIGLLMTLSSALSLAQECYDNPNLLTSSSKEFIVHNNDTVTHLESRIMWARCLVGISSGANSICSEGEVALLNWQEALQYVQTLNASGGLAGYTDWRLPNPKELASVIEYGCSKPSMNTQVFPNISEVKVWSSTPSVNRTGESLLKSWYADYGDSDTGNGSDSGVVSFANASRESQQYAVHLIRGAQ